MNYLPRQRHKRRIYAFVKDVEYAFNLIADLGVTYMDQQVAQLSRALHIPERLMAVTHVRKALQSDIEFGQTTTELPGNVCSYTDVL